MSKSAETSTIKALKALLYSSPQSQRGTTIQTGVFLRVSGFWTGSMLDLESTIPANQAESQRNETAGKSGAPVMRVVCCIQTESHPGDPRQ